MKILICVNDLIADEPGLLLGKVIGKHFNANITLLHVLWKKKSEGDRDKAEELLQQANKILDIYPVRRKVRRDDLVQRILKESQKSYDLVIVAVSRIGGYTKKDSVHRALLKQLPCCLLIAKNPHSVTRRILMCTGGLQMTEPLIEVGSKFAAALQADATLFHVTANVPSMYTGLKTIEETLIELLKTDTPVARNLRQGAAILTKNNIDAEIKLRHGSALYEIVREVDLENYDLLVVGASSANTFIKEWFYGNITQDIIETVGIPILVVNQRRAASKFSS